jgi:eukaryotic-like serine/threonine-protein kinase
MSRSSAIPANTAEATRDLQDRVGRFARTLAVISTIMLVASMANTALTSADAAPISRPSRIVHVLATLLAVGVWRVARGKSLRLFTIHVLDAALVLALGAGWALLGWGIAPSEPIEFSVILATTYTLIARSVVVPSTFVRTFVLSALAVLPTLAFFYARGMSFVPGAPASQVHTFLMFATLWCAMAVFTAALQSRLLFGLRERIREATKLGQYTLQEKIGEGGMGAVYRATHAMLRRPAAIKLLSPERAGEREVARFEREVQLTSRLRHPNTISIFDYGRTADGVFYYVMELLEGFDLDSLVEADGALPAWRVIRILSQASGALVEAHGLELIHRDIKPANIILTERSDEPDVTKVVDFGLVKSLAGATADVGTTQANAITGTPLYMAPEAITQPETIDARADIYALGAVGFFLLTGRHVFEGSSLMEVCTKHVLEAPSAPSERGAESALLDALILSCLAKAPEERPTSAAALKHALDLLAVQAPFDHELARRWWKERAPALRAARTPNAPAPRAMAMTVALAARR